MKSIDFNATMTDYEGTILPILINFLDEHKNYSANIASVGNELTVTLINGNKIKRILINGNKIKRIKDKNLSNLLETLKKVLTRRIL